MIIITTDGSIVNFDNFTDIRIYHNADGGYEINAFLPFINPDTGEYGLSKLGEYKTEEQAKEEIEFIIGAIQDGYIVYRMSGDDGNDE